MMSSARYFSHGALLPTATASKSSCAMATSSFSVAASALPGEGGCARATKQKLRKSRTAQVDFIFVILPDRTLELSKPNCYCLKALSGKLNAGFVWFRLTVRVLTIVGPDVVSRLKADQHNADE